MNDKRRVNLPESAIFVFLCYSLSLLPSPFRVPFSSSPFSHFFHLAYFYIFIFVISPILFFLLSLFLSSVSDFIAVSFFCPLTVNHVCLHRCQLVVQLVRSLIGRSLVRGGSRDSGVRVVPSVITHATSHRLIAARSTMLNAGLRLPSIVCLRFDALLRCSIAYSIHQLSLILSNGQEQPTAPVRTFLVGKPTINFSDSDCCGCVDTGGDGADPNWPLAPF